jgi:glycosyltransferase involved in cell wall biosynthesis
MRSRRILVVLPDAPLPFGNAGARWYSVLVKELSARGHRVTAYAACHDEQEIESTKQMFPAPEYDTRCYLRADRHGLGGKLESFRRPHSYMFSPTMKRELREAMAEGFDVLHLEQVWAAWAAPDQPAKTLVNVHYLFDIDMEGHSPASLKEQVVHLRSRQATRKLLQRFPHISTLSSRLTDAVRDIAPRANVSTVPLGLDSSLYPFTADRASAPKSNPVVGLVGSFNWQPTFSAGRRLVEQYWPEIKRLVPNARLLLAGRCAAQAFADLSAAPDTVIHDNVPDILPYFTDIDVMLYAPDHGSGMKVKVMEAFALGVPVVTNTDGIEGLPASDGVHAGISENDRGLVDRTVALLCNPERRHSQRIAARKLIETHCGPKSVVDSLELLYEDMLDRAPR